MDDQNKQAGDDLSADQQPKQAYPNGVPIDVDNSHVSQSQQPDSSNAVPQSTQPQQVPQQPDSPYVVPQPASPNGVPLQQMPQQPAPPYGQPQQYYQPYPSASSGKTTGALVCGIAAIVFSFAPLFGIVLGIIALVLAGKAVKEAGKNGKTTGAKACGIVGIVFSVLAVILYIVLGISVAMLASSNYNDTPRPSTPSISNEYDSQNSGEEASTDKTERAIKDAASAQLDKLKNKDAAFMEQLVGDFNDEMVDGTGYSLADLGIDSTSFAEWMLTDFDYELQNAYDREDGTGLVFADVTTRDVNAFADTFISDAQLAINADEFESLDDAGTKAHLGDIFRAAMAKTTTMIDNSVIIDAVEKNGTWVIDEDSWNAQIAYMFWLY